MNKLRQYQNIQQVQYHWQFQQKLFGVMVSFCVGLVVFMLFAFLLQIGFGVSTVFGVITAVVIYYFSSKKIVEHEFVIKHLNAHYNELESSSKLLYKHNESLSVLEQLQQSKIEQVFSTLQIQSPFYKKLQLSFISAAIIIALLAVVVFCPFNISSKKIIVTSDAQLVKPLPTIIQLINITLQPPSYLNKKVTTQENGAIKANAQTLAIWNIETNKSVSNVSIVFNDSVEIKMQSVDTEKRLWKFSKLLVTSGFYQIKVDRNITDMYQIEVLQDAPPSIRVVAPTAHLTIDYGQPTSFQLAAILNDDNGIQQAIIAATIASGKGESVQFKEQTIPLNISFQSKEKSYQIQQHISLQSFNMQPSDELYFYIVATDTYGQQTKSDVYIVELADTAALMQFDATINNIDFKPEFFRSERQIIIDAEQLLREKDTISIQQFNERSTDLGLDQKLLRLRYGKFLGEEDEENIGVEEPESLDAMEFGDPAHMLEAFGHHHDRAEDATFLDIDTKQRLKAVLNEMWKAELQLRSFKPKEALPFAYKALRLLKDLQQKSRAFVAKTAFKTTPLKPEKRLTADLSSINTISLQQNTIATTSSISNDVVATLQMLSDCQDKKEITTPYYISFSKTILLLNAKAVEQPTAFIPALKIAKKIQQQIIQQQQSSILPNEISYLQKVLHQLLQSPLVVPQKTKKAVSNTLSDQYFFQLQKSKL